MRKEVEDASSYWLSPDSIQRMIHVYLQQLCGRDQEFLIGEKTNKKLRLSQKARRELITDLRKMPRQRTSAYREWEKWLLGDNPFLAVTFDAQVASEHPETVFVNPIHPLVKQAADSFGRGKRVITCLRATAQDIQPGAYYFAIYIWEYKGIRQEVALKPVATSEEVRLRLTRLLQNSEPLDGFDPIQRSEEWSDLDIAHYEIWSREREAHRMRNRELAGYKIESLTKSHDARMALLDDQLGKASNEKIRRMRESQIASARVDYARRKSELEKAMETADIIADPIAWGIIEIAPGEQNEQ